MKATYAGNKCLKMCFLELIVRKTSDHYSGKPYCATVFMNFTH